MKILVVDDSATMRKIISDSLQKLGYDDIEQASDGAIALTKLSGIEVILTDWNMPNMNGLDFVKAVRGMPDYSKVPIVMVTTEAGKGEVIEALKKRCEQLHRKAVYPGSAQRQAHRCFKLTRKKARFCELFASKTVSAGSELPLTEPVWERELWKSKL